MNPLSYFTIAKWAVIGLLLVGMLSTIGVQTYRLNNAKADVEKQMNEKNKCYAQLEMTVGVNQNNDKVMLEASNRYARLAASYEKRLKDAAKKCEDVAVICNLPASTSTGGVPNASSNINNSLLLRLNSLYP